MKYKYKIESNTIDLVEGEFDLEATSDTIQFSAYKLQLKPTKRKLIKIFQVILTVIVYAILVPIAMAWADFLTALEDYSNANNSVNFFLFLLSAGLTFIVPLLVAIPIGKKIAKLISLKSKMPIEVVIPFSDIKNIQLGGENVGYSVIRMEFLYNSEIQMITLERQYTSFQFILLLLFKCVPDLKGNVERFGGIIEDNPADEEELCFGLISCGSYYKITNQYIENKTLEEYSQSHEDFLKFFILYSFFQVAFANMPIPINDSEPDKFLTYINTDTKKDYVAEVIGKKTDLFSAAAKKLGAFEDQNFSGEGVSYKLQILPILPIWLRYIPNKNGAFTTYFYYRTSDTEYWGTDLFGWVCFHLNNRMRSLAATMQSV
jgi:hypothetical protein